jgi:putative membrane protein
VLAAIAHLFRGFCMGTADIVPGVSGGTIALVLGIYERLVANVRQAAAVVGWLLRINGPRVWRSFQRLEFAFLVPLVSGIGLAIVVLSRGLGHLLDEYPVEMSALFFGLVAASAGAVWERMKTRDAIRLVLAAVTAAAAFVALGYRGDVVADPAWWFILVSGACAICAMILPGISGSFILLILGMYDNILDAVNDRDFAMLGIFVAGAAAGLALFAPVLSTGLKRHHDAVMAVLIGLMVGSLRVLWPWPEGIEEVGLAGPPGAGAIVIPLLLAGCGAIIVLGLMAADRRLAR